jgi:pimeloyl-ACP methyl ester carboxylesterase
MVKVGRYLLFQILVCGLAVMPGVAGATERLGFPSGNQTFSPREVQFGSSSTEADCAKITNTVWITVDGKGDCIRYFAAGLSEKSNPEVLLYMHGDRMEGGTGRTLVQISNSYQKESPAEIEKDVTHWSGQAKKPFIYLARPGTYGSSGWHAERRRIREVQLVDGAFDAIKKKHGIKTFHIAGQSGGGHLVAAMLTRRQDIGCAIISSGATAVMRRAHEAGKSVDSTGYPDPYDPADHVAEIQKTPGLRVIVLSDPQDNRVSYSSQTYFVGLLRLHGIQPLHIVAKAGGADRHDLAPKGRTALRRCVAGKSADEIKREFEDPELASSIR